MYIYIMYVYICIYIFIRFFYINFFSRNQVKIYKLRLCFRNVLYQIIIYLFQFGSTQRRCSVGQGVLGNIMGVVGEHLCWALHFNRVTGLKPMTLLISRLWRGYFPVGFVKFLVVPFLQSTSGRLVLLIRVLYHFLTLRIFPDNFLTSYTRYTISLLGLMSLTFFN